jgi:hypothetical protein
VRSFCCFLQLGKYFDVEIRYSVDHFAVESGVNAVGRLFLHGRRKLSFVSELDQGVIVGKLGSWRLALVAEKLKCRGFIARAELDQKVSHGGKTFGFGDLRL